MTDATPLQVGVVGVGNMGAHHARVLQQLSGVELRGVADVDRSRAVEMASTHDTEAFVPDDLWDAVDAAVVAVPTEAHFEVARAGLESDVHVLIEKPFVTDPSSGRRLARLAATRDLVLQVGFVERFNPAVSALFDLVDPDDIVAVRADRLGPPVHRDGSDDVVMDLMIHDIDILGRLMGGQPDEIAGATRGESYASAILEYGDTVATLTASRVTQRKVRRLAVTLPERHCIVDYIDQSLRIHRRSRPAYLRENEDIRYRHESIIEQPLVESEEPLELELTAFVNVVRSGDTPRVTPQDGLDALEVARAIGTERTEHELEVRAS